MAPPSKWIPHPSYLIARQSSQSVSVEAYRECFVHSPVLVRGSLRYSKPATIQCAERRQRFELQSSRAHRPLATCDVSQRVGSSSSRSKINAQERLSADVGSRLLGDHTMRRAAQDALGRSWSTITWR